MGPHAERGWLKDWLELNMDQKTIYDGDEYLIRLRNCYRDTGEAVINQRKGKMFATYNSRSHGQVVRVPSY